MKIEVTAVEIKDIRDKVQKYLVLQNNGNKVAINVGDKTFSGVKALLEVAQPELTNVSNNEKTFVTQPK